MKSCLTGHSTVSFVVSVITSDKVFAIWKIEKLDMATLPERNKSTFLMRTFYNPSFLQSQLMSLFSICILPFLGYLWRGSCVCVSEVPLPLPHLVHVTYSDTYPTTLSSSGIAVQNSCVSWCPSRSELNIWWYLQGALNCLFFILQFFFFFLTCTLGQHYLNWVELYK